MNSNWYVPPKKEIQNVNNQLQYSLVNGHYNQANIISRLIINQQWSPTVIYLDMIRNILNHIGTLWHEGKILISEEHRATQFCLLLMDRVRNNFRIPQPNGLKISLTTIEDDKHVIGSYMAADFFRWDGWNVELLGSSIPNNDLITYIKASLPNFVLLSSTYPKSVGKLEEAIDSIKTLEKNIKILIGGPGAQLIKDSNNNIDGFAENPLQAISLANSLVEENPSMIPLETVLMSLGYKIQTLRKNMNISQNALSEQSGLARTFISAVEQGKQNVSLASLKSISDSLGITLSSMLED
jgi:methanogenic corrinoid protein MtbC1/DNA-binding XRE family transcriptional regulator|tara:strand:+ start:30 stop:920 length:891 start_codon:yes stop_codon:yes gene_type:complete